MKKKDRQGCEPTRYRIASTATTVMADIESRVSESEASASVVDYANLRPIIGKFRHLCTNISLYNHNRIKSIALGHIFSCFFCKKKLGQSDLNRSRRFVNGPEKKVEINKY